MSLTHKEFHNSEDKADYILDLLFYEVFQDIPKENIILIRYGTQTYKTFMQFGIEFKSSRGVIPTNHILTFYGNSPFDLEVSYNLKPSHLKVSWDHSGLSDGLDAISNFVKLDYYFIIEQYE